MSSSSGAPSLPPGLPAVLPASGWSSLRRRLALPAVALLLTHLVGVVGYWALWRADGGTVGDALFMTFTTVTTIGFGEVRPLGPVGRVLTMVIAAGGIGSAFYSFTVILDWASSDEVRRSRKMRKMLDRVSSLSGHFLVAGFGRVGRETSRELRASGKDVVVIDLVDENVEAATAAGLTAIRGDASDDEVLRTVGIERAAGLIVTTASDATNLFIVMSARLLAPSLLIVSRAVDASAEPKLERAGATRAISPYAIGGKRMAQLVLSPRAVDFFETALRRGGEALSIGELRVASGLGVGETLGALRERSGSEVTFLAVLRAPDGTVALPRDDLRLSRGDHLLALGTDEQLSLLEAGLEDEGPLRIADGARLQARK